MPLVGRALSKKQTYAHTLHEINGLINKRLEKQTCEQYIKYAHGSIDHRQTDAIVCYDVA